MVQLIKRKDKVATSSLRDFAQEKGIDPEKLKKQIEKNSRKKELASVGYNEAGDVINPELLEETAELQKSHEEYLRENNNYNTSLNISEEIPENQDIFENKNILFEKTEEIKNIRKEEENNLLKKIEEEKWKRKIEEAEKQMEQEKNKLKKLLTKYFGQPLNKQEKKETAEQLKELMTRYPKNFAELILNTKNNKNKIIDSNLINFKWEKESWTNKEGNKQTALIFKLGDIKFINFGEPTDSFLCTGINIQEPKNEMSRGKTFVYGINKPKPILIKKTKKQKEMKKKQEV